MGEGTGADGNGSKLAARASMIFFDVGNTLITSRYRIDTVYAKVFRNHGAALPEGDGARELLGPVISSVWRSVQDALEPGEDRYARAGGGRGFWRRFVDEIADRTNLELDREAAFEELYVYYSRDEAWDVYEDVRPALAVLEAGGARMGIVSNWDARLPALLETLGLAAYFDPIVVSAIEHVEKPSREIYRLAAERAGVDPAACVHVGDSEPLDVIGARVAGMTPLLVVRGHAGKLASSIETGRERLTNAPVVTDLRALPAFVDERSGA